VEDLTLLRTKLYRPPLTQDLVPRPRLLERLDRGRRRPLTLVSAPAGYGKTTLVSAWLQSLAQETLSVPGAWLSLDEEDNDLVRFTTYLLAAVRTLFPDACPDTLALLQGATLPPLPVLARSLINELDALDASFVLALDDYRLIHDESVHRLLDALLAHPPRHMHLVLITRADPPLNLVRRRARGEVVKVCVGDLRFTEDETSAFLQRELGDVRRDRTVAGLLERAEGWVVGLARRLPENELAALHCQAGDWLAAGDTGTAARLVAEHRHRAMNQEQWHRLRRWLGLLPREVVQGDPQLLIVEAWLLIGWAEMTPVAERVGALLARLDPKAPDTQNLQAEFDTLRSPIAYHVTDGPKCLALARRALQRLPR